MGVRANCTGSHTANNRRCPVFRREARARGLKTVYYGETTRPFTLHLKAKTDYSSRTRSLHGTGTTGKNSQSSRATAYRFSFLQLDSSEHAVEIEKGQKIEEEKEDATTAATAVAATASAINGTESARTSPRRERE
ncbi:hypothetical protein EVAR_18824_1 [Eumeta japonica]|uniref:Uncharacterized protein n=1 Tax=Eumeta variegata TaxID=151549 RepID=A0A4C1UME0_EUMVA|nr:hypothetical protein EVAR_18824_1 [Eumeta japonica]